MGQQKRNDSITFYRRAPIHKAAGRLEMDPFCLIVEIVVLSEGKKVEVKNSVSNIYCEQVGGKTIVFNSLVISAGL